METWFMPTINGRQLAQIMHEEGFDAELPLPRINSPKTSTELLRLRDKPAPYKPSSPRLANLSVRHHTGPLSLA